MDSHICILSVIPFLIDIDVYRYWCKHIFIITRDFDFHVSIVIKVRNHSRVGSCPSWDIWKSAHVPDSRGDSWHNNLHALRICNWISDLWAVCMRTHFERCFGSQPSIIHTDSGLGFIRSVAPCCVSRLLDLPVESRTSNGFEFRGSFFLSWVVNTQLNHWTKRVMSSWWTT